MLPVGRRSPWTEGPMPIVPYLPASGRLLARSRDNAVEDGAAAFRAFRRERPVHG